MTSETNSLWRGSFSSLLMHSFRTTLNDKRRHASIGILYQEELERNWSFIYRNIFIISYGNGSSQFHLSFSHLLMHSFRTTLNDKRHCAQTRILSSWEELERNWCEIIEMPMCIKDRLLSRWTSIGKDPDALRTEVKNIYK
jgi:hypothetical protein